MSDILEIVKRAALDSVEQNAPAAVMAGKVVSSDPFQIQVEQKLILAKEHLIKLESAGTLSKGMQVLLLRKQGGQKYIILGEVVEI